VSGVEEQLGGPGRLACAQLLQQRGMYMQCTNSKDDGELKKRLVLDLLRCVNPAVKDDDYRMTTLQDAVNSTRKGDFQVVFDLKSAFHHVRLHPSSYELMGFKVGDEEGTITYYCYVVLVFGFKVAAQVLGRVLKPVISFLIQNGIPVTLYIDDGLLVGPSKARVVRRYKFTLDVFDKAGCSGRAR
jgi:hypothetical protein